VSVSSEDRIAAFLDYSLENSNKVICGPKKSLAEGQIIVSSFPGAVTYCRQSLALYLVQLGVVIGYGQKTVTFGVRPLEFAPYKN
jgi:hypothetical protein